MVAWTLPTIQNPALGKLTLRIILSGIGMGVVQGAVSLRILVSQLHTFSIKHSRAQTVESRYLKTGRVYQLQLDHHCAGHDGRARMYSQVHRQRKSVTQRHWTQETSQLPSGHRRHAATTQPASSARARATQKPCPGKNCRRKMKSKIRCVCGKMHFN